MIKCICVICLVLCFYIIQQWVHKCSICGIHTWRWAAEAMGDFQKKAETVAGSPGAVFLRSKLRSAITSSNDMFSRVRFGCLLDKIFCLWGVQSDYILFVIRPQWVPIMFMKFWRDHIPCYKIAICVWALLKIAISTLSSLGSYSDHTFFIFSSW